MPLHDFVCQFCGFQDRQYAAWVGHHCSKRSGELVELVRLDDPMTTPVDICCDGCDAEWLGDEHHAYSDKVAREMATADGWTCNRKTGDWCPRCVAERKAHI